MLLPLYRFFNLLYSSGTVRNSSARGLDTREIKTCFPNCAFQYKLFIYFIICPICARRSRNDFPSSYMSYISQQSTRRKKCVETCPDDQQLLLITACDPPFTPLSCPCPIDVPPYTRDWMPDTNRLTSRVFIPMTAIYFPNPRCYCPCIHRNRWFPFFAIF